MNLDAREKLKLAKELHQVGMGSQTLLDRCEAVLLKALEDEPAPMPEQIQADKVATHARPAGVFSTPPRAWPRPGQPEVKS